MRVPTGRRRDEGNHALVTMASVGLAVLCALVGGVFALLGGSRAAAGMAQALIFVSAVTALLVYARYLPRVARRIADALRAPFTDAEVETGPVVLGIEAAGLVVAGVGIVGVLLFYEWCGRGTYTCTSIAEAMGIAAPYGLYRFVVGFVFYLGGGLLALGWIAEGFRFTGDRGGDDEEHVLERFR